MIEIEESSGNVYEDLGTPNANEMRVKSQLAAKIGEIIKARHLTQVQASEILGLYSTQAFRDVARKVSRYQ